MRQLVSIIVPVFNEDEVLPEFHKRLSVVLNRLSFPYEIIYVNDGSSDNTLKILYKLRETDPHVAILNLSRNFGKEIALTAGLEHSIGDAVIVIDADLQDPPELIPIFLERWQDGADVVYGRRLTRKGETILKKLTAHQFYRFMQHIGRVRIPEDVGDFRLLSRQAVDALKQCKEYHRFMKGLFTWIGFNQVAVDYHREPRHLGNTKWNYWKLWNLAIEGITSFSIDPLKISTYLGLITACIAVFYGIFIIIKTLVYGIDVPGYASLMVVMLFLGGVQLIVLGVIGEYLGRIFNETKRRPLYLIKEWIPSINKR